MKLSNLKVDTEKAKNGVWELVGDGFKVCVAHSNSPAYLAFLTKNARGHGRAFMKGRLDEKTMLAIKPIMKEAAARHLLVGWEGLEEDDGEDIPFSTAKAVELLTDPECEPLFNMVMEISQDEALFRKEEDEADASN